MDLISWKEITDVKEQEKETYLILLKFLFQFAWILTIQISHFEKVFRASYFKPV